MKLLRLIILIACVFSLSAHAQGKKKNKKQKPVEKPLYVFYSCSGLGNNLGTKQPVVHLTENKLVLTSEQTSYTDKAPLTTDTVFKTELRKSSIDSIRIIFKKVSDTLMYGSNLCVAGGFNHFFKIALGSDTARYELMNSFDYTCLKVIDIINTYLPEGKKLPPNEKLIKDAEACWRRVRKSAGG